MDKLRRDTMFADLSDRDIGEAVLMEMRRRGLYGALFMFPKDSGQSVFVSSSPEGSMADFAVADQLRLLAEVAQDAVIMRSENIKDEIDTSFNPSDWVN